MKIKCVDIAKVAALRMGRLVGRELVFHCPNHDDNFASLSVSPTKNVWMCGPCGKSGGAWDFVEFITGYTKRANQIHWLLETGLMEERPRAKGKLICTYTYKDPHGREYLQVRRFANKDGKSFAQYHYDNGEWKPGANGVELFPYRLDEWRRKPVVYVVEGEKDADNLWKMGIPATTNVMGAGKWKEEYNKWFDGKKVVILPDNDSAGIKHATEVAENICEVALGVKIVTLPGLPPKGDFSDWVRKCGGTKESLFAEVKNTKFVTLINPKSERKAMLRRANADLSDIFEKTRPDYDKCWDWMKNNTELWAAIQTAQDRLDFSLEQGDDLDIIKDKITDWRVAFKNAIAAYILHIQENIE